MTTTSGSLLEGLAALVDYPVETLEEPLLDCLEDPAIEPGAVADLERFAGAIADLSVSELQEEYAATFDFGQACSLDVGWHLFGDTHERGAFMAALREDLDRVGVVEDAELPDHLTHVLALLARDPDGAPALAETIAPAVDAIERALVDRASPYAYLVAAIGAELTALRSTRQKEASHP